MLVNYLPKERNFLSETDKKFTTETYLSTKGTFFGDR